MFKTVKIPWGTWYRDDETHFLEFPDPWQVHSFEMQNAKEIRNVKDIKKALNNPVDSPTIQE